MEKNYSSTDHSEVFEPALSLPHFDEEITLLSARPVVPLHEVKAKTRSRRHVIFGLTILAAILVGATSATLLMVQRGQNSQSSEAGMSQPTVSSSGAAGGSTSEPAEARLPVASEADKEPQTVEQPSASRPSTNKRPTAAMSRSAVIAADRVDDERNQDFENNDRELRRAERRDARREARRQIRSRREQVGDEVLRIREIFEGSPRP